MYSWLEDRSSFGNSALGYTAAGIGGGSPPGIAMSDDDADGIWEVTIPLEKTPFSIGNLEMVIFKTGQLLKVHGSLILVVLVVDMG